jgi:hypothetical protein
MNIYLDIDGVLLTKQGGFEANYLYEFLKFVTENHDCYWLTSHCKGDAESVLRHLKYNKVSEKSLELLKKVKPTNFELAKTEAIDFSKDFLWFDDYIFDREKEDLIKHNAFENWIKVDLRKNENMLGEFFASFPVPVKNHKYKKEKKEIIIEVETKKTLVIDQDQQEAFKKYANKSGSRKFRK